MRPLPNLLWIVTTQWRAQACGYAGDAQARTPALDGLASQSVNFAEAVTPHPFGPYARAAMLTGVTSPENGIRDYFDPLPVGTQTIAHALAARGYLTAFFGKWHLARRDPAAALVGPAHARMVVPVEARGGFEFWEGFESGFLLNDPWLHGTRLPTPTQFAGYQSDVVTARATEWMERKEPWFCVISLEAPHPPYDAPSAGIMPSDPGAVTLPPNVPRGGDVEARARRELAGYYAHIEATDRAIGRVLERVSPRDTAVVFTSVHGDMHGAHGRFRKGWPYEESIRVPFLLRAPQLAPKMERSPISLLDLPALTLALAEGRQFTAPTKAATISMPAVVQLRDQCDRRWNGWRSPRRKMVFDERGQLWLAFDLEADPYEMNNLAETPAAAEIVRKWRGGG